MSLPAEATVPSAPMVHAVDPESIPVRNTWKKIAETLVRGGGSHLPHMRSEGTAADHALRPRLETERTTD